MCQPSCCVCGNETHSFMKWDCVSFQYAALQPPCRSWWGEADAEVKMERVQRELMCGRKKSKSIFEVRRRPVVLMGRRDARSGWKRQSVLTGKARLVIQFVCEKKVRRKISQSLRMFSILPDKGRFWRRTQRFIGNARISRYYRFLKLCAEHEWCTWRLFIKY